MMRRVRQLFCAVGLETPRVRNITPVVMAVTLLRGRHKVEVT